MTDIDEMIAIQGRVQEILKQGVIDDIDRQYIKTHFDYLVKQLHQIKMEKLELVFEISQLRHDMEHGGRT